MLRKLLKHEWKSASRTLLVVHGIVLLFAVLTRISLAVSGGLESDSLLAGLMIMLSVMVIFTAVIFTMIFVGFRFYKSVFTDQGYLTNTLPVTPQQIMVSKGLVGVIWEVLDFMIVIAAVLILVANGEVFRDMGTIIHEAFRFLFSGDASLGVWLTLISLILAPFAIVIEMYVSVAVGNLLSGHKVLGAVGAFVAISTVQQIIATITMGLTSYKAFAVKSEVEANSVSLHANALEVMDTTMLVSLIIIIVFMVAGYLVTKYIMTKRLNLQ